MESKSDILHPVKLWVVKILHFEIQFSILISLYS